MREALESLSMASKDIVGRILVPLGLRGACWAGGGRLGGHGVQKPNVSHRFGSIFVPQTRPWRLQDGPQRAQDGPKMAPRGSKMIPNGPKMAPREPKMVRTTPRTPPDQRSEPIFAPLGLPKGHPESLNLDTWDPKKVTTSSRIVHFCTFEALSKQGSKVGRPKDG